MQFEYTAPQTPLETAFGGHYCINAFGHIERGDAELFAHFVLSSQAPPRTHIYLNSPGGHVETAIEIGRQIRSYWMATEIGQYVIDHDSVRDPIHEFIKPRKFLAGECLSAATLCYLGGKLRYFNPGSKFGVHRFSFRNPTPDDLERSQFLSAKIALFVQDMGIDQRFLEISAATESRSMQYLSLPQLTELRVVTGGETEVEWTMQGLAGAIYVRGERDSIFGHHKIILGFAKTDGFFLYALIESQGRETELTSMLLVEMTIEDDNADERLTDVSDRAKREAKGIYTHIHLWLTRDEAINLANSRGFGLRVRSDADAELFLGISPMRTEKGRTYLTSFVQSLS